MLPSEKECTISRKSRQDDSSEDTDTQIESLFKEWEKRKKALLSDKPPRKRKRETFSPADEEEREYEKWYKEYRDANMPVASRQSINNAIRLLSRGKRKLSTNESRLRQFCRGESTYGTFFDSPTCLLVAIRRCILTRNWGRLAELLLILITVNKQRHYRAYIKQMCELTFKMHPANNTGEFYEKYQRLMGIFQRK